MSRMVLYDITDKNGSSSFIAYLENRKLSLHGDDFGAVTEEVWGNSEYEFTYYFDEANTKALFKALGCSDDMTDEDKLNVLKKNYHEYTCDLELRTFCEEHDIQYMFSNYC